MSRPQGLSFLELMLASIRQTPKSIFNHRKDGKRKITYDIDLWEDLISGEHPSNGENRTFFLLFRVKDFVTQNFEFE